MLWCFPVFAFPFLAFVSTTHGACRDLPDVRMLRTSPRRCDCLPLLLVLHLLTTRNRTVGCLPRG
jgi:hypothetical protein